MTLRDLGRECDETLTKVLNGTVTDGIRLNYIGDRSGALGYVGYGINLEDLIGRPVPLGIGRGVPRCWLRITQSVTLDDGEARYLKTVRASVAVLSSEAGEDENQLLRYDFDRNQEGGYPTAHLHVFGESVALDRLNDALGRERALFKLHYPVGGVRFRPCLEDVIEFLIYEGFVEPRPGWEQVLDEGRQKFHAIQLKAAVRHRPELAAEQLSEMGWTVEPPAED